ncbi:S-layer homology domain-containing protein [Collinsella ihumii]|uniref:S-layer homology domain-containing protein n=1 Tax=Collinsella ihumii TaxID=1720204 RepID=A0AAW7JN40_9ACTN|nr:S-layer homology domain-containing protein [Collinsella ihumii]MDN0068779.1 S-layer homology domain-containing protein [Collinsella ihumii]
MTACVNRKHTKKVAAVVTASLVGALSLGAAPVAAMADTGIDLQATDNQDFAKGTIEWRSGEPGDEFAYTGYYTGLVPKTITTVSGQEYDLELAQPDAGQPSDHAYFAYAKLDASGNDLGFDYRDADGNIKDVKGYWVTDRGSATRPTDPGTYAVVIYYTGDNEGTSVAQYYSTIAESFTIANPDFSDALIYDGDDQTDTEFSYTGADDSAQVQDWIDRINVSVNGEKLVKGTDYILEIWEKGGAGALATNTPLETGTTYIVKVIGQNRFAGEKAEKEFTFGKLDLSDAVVEGNIVLVGAGQPDKDLAVADAIKSINGIDWADLSNEAQTHLKLEFVSDPDGNQTFNGTEGTYTYKVTGSGDYLTGTATVKVVYASDLATVDMTPCTTEWRVDAAGDRYALVDLSRNTVHFDLSKIAFDDAAGNDLDLDEDEYTVTVVKQDGSAATAADLKVPGTYYVKVDVWTKNSDGTYTAGSQVEKVVVSYDHINRLNDIFFAYDGQNYNFRASDVYNGKNFAEDMAIKVIADSGATLVEGTDYTVTFEKVNDDDSRTAVEQIVDAGEYVITVKGITFDNGNGTEFYFDVDKATPDILVNWDLVTNEDLNTGYYSYTGEAITPTFTFLGVDGQPLELTADDYTVEYVDFVSEDKKTESEEVDEVKAAGRYTAKIKLADTVANYAYDATARFHPSDETDRVYIFVSTAGVFADVPMTGQWYSQVVYDAVKLDYMNGYAGTKLFGPNDSITRGQVACVLYNMSGASIDESNSAAYNELFGWNTGFSDVDGKAYYAKAIYWAKSTGVVNGYGDGTFAPDAQITREEFAAMLSNYAENMGDDIEGAEADLSAFGDASQVSDWATEAIEWAVANEVMGNGGFLAPTANITRAEAAAMAVNYQPEKPSTIIQ